MPIILGILSAGVVALWFFAHQVVKRRFAGLKADLPAVHRFAIIAPTEGEEPPQLIALGVDLLRKSHCTDPYEALTLAEQQMVLHVHALDVLPAWMSRYGALALSSRDRAILGQLRQVKTSRPQVRKQHFGAVKALLRSRDES